jgi:hypothetical protein
MNEYSFILYAWRRGLSSGKHQKTLPIWSEIGNVASAQTEKSIDARAH